jgi:transcriptional regulator with XRE-family HTH domain
MYTVLNKQYLRSRRKKLGLTQQELAEAIGAYQQDISALECGRYTEVKTSRLASLAAALGVKAEDVIVQRGVTMHDNMQHAATWASVAPLIARWQIALVPHRDGTWDVLAGFDRLSGVHDAHHVAWPDVPQTIADLAARCEAAAGEAGSHG